MSKAETVKRYTLFIAGLFFTALGVAFTKHAGLGVSPISSVANVLSCRFTALSMGNWLIVWNCILILGQILILRKNFRPIQLLQLPLSFFFGWFTDLGMWIVRPIPVNAYPVCLLLVLVGIVILGFGISLTLIANVIMNSGEAFVKAVSDTSGKEFGTVKIAFDIFCVVIALIVSLIFFEFTIVGTREGTVLSALFTGFSVKCWSGKLQMPLQNFLTKGHAA